MKNDNITPTTPKSPSYFTKVEYKGIKREVSRFAYSEGVVPANWTNMKTGQIINIEDTTDKDNPAFIDTKEKTFAVLGWVSMNAMIFEKAQERTESHAIFDTKSKPKSYLSLFGFWADKDGNLPKSPQLLVRLDLKTYTAGDMLAALKKPIRNEILETAPLHAKRIRFQGVTKIKVSVGNEEHSVNKFKFEVFASPNEEDAAQMSDYLADIEANGMAVYDEDQWVGALRYNSFNSMKIAFSNKAFLPPQEFIVQYNTSPTTELLEDGRRKVTFSTPLAALPEPAEPFLLEEATEDIF